MQFLSLHIHCSGRMPPRSPLSSGEGEQMKTLMRNTAEEAWDGDVGPRGGAGK